MAWNSFATPMIGKDVRAAFPSRMVAAAPEARSSTAAFTAHLRTACRSAQC